MIITLITRRNNDDNRDWMISVTIAVIIINIVESLMIIIWNTKLNGQVFRHIFSWTENTWMNEWRNEQINELYIINT